MSKKIFQHWGLILFFLLSWLWAFWWMGDVMRIAYERSFFAPDATLMYWLWQQPFGWLWIIGRVLLLTYHWPWAGGLLVAVLLTAGSWLVGYCLRLPQRWRWLQYLPAGVWMMWTATVGLNLFYAREPGRILGVPFLVVTLFAIAALITWLAAQPSSPLPSSPKGEGRSALPLGGDRRGLLVVVCVNHQCLTILGDGEEPRQSMIAQLQRVVLSI